MTDLRRPWFGLMVALVCVGVGTARADVSPADEYGRRIKVYQTVQPHGDTPFGEQVNLYTGDLTFRQADVVLEGMGPTISLARSLASRLSDTHISQPYAFGNWTLSIPRIETLIDSTGWVSESGAGRCTNFDRPSYITLTPEGWHGIELVTESGDRQQLLKRGPQNTSMPQMTNAAGNQIAFPAVTQQNWQIGCLTNTSNGEPGEAFFVVAPNGTKYWFDYLVYDGVNTLYENDPYSGEIIRQRRKLATMYVSQIQDRFGNTLTYDYGGDDKLDSITASDGRHVTLTWRTDYRLVDHITVQPSNAQPRVWRYEYGNFSSYTASNMTFTSATLTGVVLPDNTRWGFDLHGLGGGAIPDAILSKCNIRSQTNSTTPSVSTITHPNGLVGKFSVAKTWHARNYVPSDCRYPPFPQEGEPWEDTPPLFSTYSLVRKEFSGPGLATKAWTYAYEPSAASTTSDACAASGTCPQTKWVNVTTPKGDLTTYVFSNRWGETEGKLLRSDAYQGTATPALRTEKYTYASSTTGPWPASLGGALDDPRANTAKDSTWTPMSAKEILQQGRSFKWQAATFDAYANPTTVTRSSDLDSSYTRTETTEYFHSLTLWVLSQVKKVTDTTGSPSVMQETLYDAATALPVSTYAFGQLKQSFTYYVQGVLKTVKDALNRTFTFSTYERGIAKRIDFPDTNYVSAEVDDFGQLAWVRDPLNNTTQYGFNAMGRLTSMTPPTGWNGSAIDFVSVGGVEYGIAAGHWRRTVTKGNARSVTYYDGEWRPILSYDYDINNVAGSARFVARTYDALGRESFVSYPSATAPTWTATGWTLAGNPMLGTRTTYDALGRPTQVTQDSELSAPLNTLNTSYAYLTDFKTKVTDPRNATTTTSYQAFDTPSTNAPVYIELPLGVTTQIVRDRYGKTLSLTRGGPGIVPVTRSYIYDSQQRLCRLSEPETGNTVTAYNAADNVDWAATGLTITGTGCGHEQVATSARITRQYDAMDRVLSIDYPGSTNDVGYTYDAAGNVASATNRGITAAQDVIWTYGARNSLGLPTSETLNVDGFTYKLQYVYDLQGSLKTVQYPDDRVVDYAPDALGRATKAGSYATNVSYFPDGELKYYRYGNGIEYLAQKNTRSLPKNLTYSSASGSLLYSQDLTYDENANLKSATDLSPVTPSRTKSMDYDALNRLTKATAGALWGEEIYIYDALDNIQSITRNGVNNVFEYNALNRLTRIANASNNQTLHSYDYDSKGNVTTRDGAALTFDDANRLLTYGGKGGYRYDAWARRVKRSNASGVGQSYYAYSQSGQLLFEHDLTTNKLTDYVLLGGKLVAKIAADAPIPALQAPALSTSGSYAVSWSAISGASSYVLEESANGGAWTQVQSSAATSWSATGKAHGSYTYRAKACFVYGCGNVSPTVSVVVDLRPQSAPTLTVPSYNPSSSYTVSWTSVPTATSYEVQEAGSSGVWGGLYTGANLSFAVSGRSSGNYSYRGRACNAYGCGAWSATVSTSVELPPSSAPSLSGPSQSFSGSYSLSWTAIGGVTHYPLEQSANGGAWTVVQDTAALTWSVSGKPAGSYAYRARACNPAGCSGYSATITVTVTYPPTAAATVTAPASSITGNFSVGWTAVATATSYTLQKNINGGAWTTLYTGAGTSYAVSGQTDGAIGFRVQGCNVAGCGPWSASATTQVEITPATPVLSGYNEIEYAVRPPWVDWYLSWTAVAGATKYELQVQNGTYAPGIAYSGPNTSYSMGGHGNRTFWVRACKGTSNCSPWSAPLAL